ncbi:hypothetical protein BAS10_04660 [Elizabethkingia meningoseptica]|uniref:hypothetical protein n=1 Tax=Elizabethkingia meningoseptica TaxID=238 RepID=UPI00099AD002|nr:hypothetical protein [Elizabethkingia meningoseptica]OPB98962.1 hypothetical protein BAS10_04660 [Elizabethkingia meningoseptica]
MAYNTNTAFGRAKVAPKHQGKVGSIFLKTMQECDNENAANDILLAAYMLNLSNYFEIENLYYEKYPSTLSI